MSSVRSHVLTLGTHLVALFGKTVEPLRGGASLEEADHWEQAWRCFTPCFLSAAEDCDARRQLLPLLPHLLGSPAKMDCAPLEL